MTVIERLASSLSRSDEEPNIELAQYLCESGNKVDIDELVRNLNSSSKAIRSDCIKVLYEIGYQQPQFIEPYVGEFISLLESKDNRMVWGAMIALGTIAARQADEIYSKIDTVLKTIYTGSVITVDNGISVLAGVASVNETYARRIIPYLLEHMRTCRVKEVGQHAERCLPAVNAENIQEFRAVLYTRLDDLRPAQKRRVNKIIKQLEKSATN